MHNLTVLELEIDFMLKQNVSKIKERKLSIVMKFQIVVTYFANSPSLNLNALKCDTLKCHPLRISEKCEIFLITILVSQCSEKYFLFSDSNVFPKKICDKFSFLQHTS